MRASIGGAGAAVTRAATGLGLVALTALLLAALVVGPGRAGRADVQSSGLTTDGPITGALGGTTAAISGALGGTTAAIGGALGGTSEALDGTTQAVGALASPPVSAVASTVTSVRNDVLPAPATPSPPIVDLLVLPPLLLPGTPVLAVADAPSSGPRDPAPDITTQRPGPSASATTAASTPAPAPAAAPTSGSPPDTPSTTAAAVATALHARAVGSAVVPRETPPPSGEALGPALRTAAKHPASYAARAWRGPWGRLPSVAALPVLALGALAAVLAATAFRGLLLVGDRADNRPRGRHVRRT